MSLRDAYIMENQEAGHDWNCAWGAGADCSCGLVNRRNGHHRNCRWGDPEWPGDCNCGKDGPNTLFTPPQKPVEPVGSFDEDDIPF